MISTLDRLVAGLPPHRFRGQLASERKAFEDCCSGLFERAFWMRVTSVIPFSRLRKRLYPPHSHPSRAILHGLSIPELSSSKGCFPISIPMYDELVSHTCNYNAYDRATRTRLGTSRLLKPAARTARFRLIPVATQYYCSLHNVVKMSNFLKPLTWSKASATLGAYLTCCINGCTVLAVCFTVILV